MMTASFIYANGGGRAIEATDVEVLCRDSYIKKNTSNSELNDNVEFVSKLDESTKIVTLSPTRDDAADTIALMKGTKLYVMNSVGNTIATYEG